MADRRGKRFAQSLVLAGILALCCSVQILWAAERFDYDFRSIDRCLRGLEALDAGGSKSDLVKIYTGTDPHYLLLHRDPHERAGIVQFSANRILRFPITPERLAGASDRAYHDRRARLLLAGGPRGLKLAVTYFPLNSSWPQRGLMASSEKKGLRIEGIEAMTDSSKRILEGEISRQIGLLSRSYAEELRLYQRTLDRVARNPGSSREYADHSPRRGNRRELLPPSKSTYMEALAACSALKGEKVRKSIETEKRELGSLATF